MFPVSLIFLVKYALNKSMLSVDPILKNILSSSIGSIWSVLSPELFFCQIKNWLELLIPMTFTVLVILLCLNNSSEIFNKLLLDL